MIDKPSIQLQVEQMAFEVHRVELYETILANWAQGQLPTIEEKMFLDKMTNFNHTTYVISRFNQIKLLMDLMLEQDAQLVEIVQLD